MTKDELNRLKQKKCVTLVPTKEEFSESREFVRKLFRDRRRSYCTGGER